MSHFFVVLIALGAAGAVMGLVFGEESKRAERAHMENLQRENEKLREELDMCWQIERDRARSCSYALKRAGGPCEPAVEVRP